jgi:hypothetical protein
MVEIRDASSPLSQWPVPDFAQTFWRGARDKVMAMVEHLRLTPF